MSVQFLPLESPGPDRGLERPPGPEEGPDLLDRLVQQEREERALHRRAAALPSLEAMLRLLELQAAPERTEPWGRAITRGGPPPPWHLARLEEQAMWTMAAQLSPPGFPPCNLKLPPPGHPPAVSLQACYSPHPSGLGPRPPPPGSALSLHHRLEEAQLQLRAIERERKRAEAALARQRPGLSRLGPGPALPTVGGGAPRLPPRPSRLDRLVVDSWREHARVSALLERMARVQGAPLHPGIRCTAQGWLEAVLALQGLRRGQVGEAAADTCLADYSKAVRRARTSLWAALQAVTIPEAAPESPGPA